MQILLILSFILITINLMSALGLNVENIHNHNTNIIHIKLYYLVAGMRKFRIPLLSMKLFPHLPEIEGEIDSLFLKSPSLF